MKRLDFVLPEWTRVMWTSEKAREVWEPRVRRISAAWEQVERLSVVHGVRKACLQTVAPERLPKLSEWAAEKRLTLVPLGQQGSGDSYSSCATPVVAGKAWQYRVAITRPELALSWHKAWAVGDNHWIGARLGFPTCCREFFQRVWIEERGLDSTWAMADGAAQPDETTRQIDVPPPESNVLLRWLGVRLVPHLPCSFGCEETVQLGKALAAVGIRHGFAAEVTWTRDMLSWPIEWSALHGIAEIKTPVFKISARTDATPVKYTVQARGVMYPEMGASGLRFPYETRRPLPIARRVDTWTDNGFSSEAAMQAAHAVVVDAVKAAGPSGSVLDLGCGNGALLEAIVRVLPDIVPHGLDVDAGKIERARARLPRGCFKAEPIETFAASDTYGAVLLMPGRLIEMGAERAAAFWAQLSRMTSTVVLYAYADWLTRHDGLERLARRAGIEAAIVRIKG